MKIIVPKCPNCKVNYHFKKSDSKKYKNLLVHDERCCPYGVEIYHINKQRCIESARKFILQKFPYLRKIV